MGDVYELRVMEDGLRDHTLDCDSEEQATRLAHTLSRFNPYRSYEAWYISAVGDAVKIAEFQRGQNLAESKPKE